jgi:hypothetical protein
MVVHSAMRVVLSLLAVLMLAVAGCRAPASGATRPAGLTIGATVRAPAGADPGGTVRPPRELRPARYHLETDSWLRVATGPVLATPAAGFPPKVRRVTPQQADQIWLLVRDAGLHVPDHPGNREDFTPPPPHPTLTSAVFEVTTDFRPRMIVVLLDGATPESAAAKLLLDRLADLAWIAE